MLECIVSSLLLDQPQRTKKVGEILSLPSNTNPILSSWEVKLVQGQRQKKEEKIVKWLLTFKTVNYKFWIAWNNTDLECKSALSWLEHVVHHLQS